MFRKDFRNELLKRREVEVVMPFEGNPGVEEVKKFLAGKLKHDAENIAVKTVKNNFGSQEFLIEALAYDSKNDLVRIEPVPKKKKTAGAN